MKKRSDLAVMLRLVGLVKPLMGFMALAIAMGVAGFLCAQFIPIFGGFAIVNALGGTGLPAADVLEYRLAGGAKFMVRPSGTEPKIKVYLSAVGKSGAEADAVNERLAQAAAAMMQG